MIAIIARVELAPRSVDAYVTAARTVVAQTREEAGCQWYAITRDICDSNVIWISEQWESKAHLDAHLRSDHIRRFLEVTASLDVLGLEPRQYDVSSVGAVQLPED